jgi:hypothetical protein
MTDATKISVKKFDASKLATKHFVGVMCAKRGSGKSYLTRDVLYRLHCAGFPRCVIFSQTETANCFFSDFIPGVFIHSPFNLNTLTDIWNKQKEIIMKQSCGQLDANQDTRILILLDDCSFERKTFTSNVIREMVCNGRHYNLTLIITLQYLMDMPPTLRSNIDFAWFFADNIRTNRERLYRQFCGFYPSYRTFEAVFEACTGDYECMVVNSTTTSTAPEDIVSYYKAEAVDFKFGPPSLWKFHERLFISEQDEFILRQKMSLQKASRNTLTKTNGNSSITVVHET